MNQENSGETSKPSSETDVINDRFARLLTQLGRTIEKAKADIEQSEQQLQEINDLLKKEGG